MHSNVVLIIDDDDDDRGFFSEALHEVNPDFICREEIDGRAAIEYLEKTNLLPEAIFLDMNMPRMNGFECLQEIKKSTRLKHIPVAIYSTFHSPDLEKKAYSLGASCYLKKPLHFIEIIDCIRSFITQFRN